ncbi:unnamed protein product [marine sediment metagenome]|uniref:DNA recombination-mediator protein A n=1 Tax=marine sediment metagenome TaxID=412755 RepID=X0S8R0_9ZZZZ
MIYYAGIGSRKTPLPTLDIMTAFGKRFAELGLTLRSGGADGADTAWEKGCDLAHGEKEIYLPRAKFNGNPSFLHPPSDAAIEMGKKFHPLGQGLPRKYWNMMGRNCHQVLGQDLETRVAFVMCWTKHGDLVGGTAQALRIAIAYDIPAFNLYNPDFVQLRNLLVSLGVQGLRDVAETA